MRRGATFEPLSTRCQRVPSISKLPRPCACGDSRADSLAGALRSLTISPTAVPDCAARDAVAAVIDASATSNQHITRANFAIDRILHPR